MASQDSSSTLTRPEVVFEDYVFYASLTRQEEDAASRQVSPQGSDTTFNEKKSWLSGLVGQTEAKTGPELPPMTEEDIEIANASRAIRITSWTSVFFLITTDTFGPFTVPFAMAQLGWVPGVILYFFMALFSLYAGLLLWALFIRLDSFRYPLKTYGDVAERIFGKVARHICTLFQTIQLLVIVAIVCIMNGSSLSQITKGRLCFQVCIVIFPIVGMLTGQARTLKGYGIFANWTVWLNLVLIFLVMGFVAHSQPNYPAAQLSLGVSPGPVMTQTFVSQPLAYRVNGMMNMVLAYGGAFLFIEIMAEMRRPMDFWKGLVLAQIVIVLAYILFGCFVYAFQGQFTLPLVYQGISKYAWQTVGNVIALISGLIAAGLFSHVSSKVLYINFIEGRGGPRLMSSKGRIIWGILIFFYWSIAYVLAAAIPQVQTINGLISAVAVVQFSYTFPAFLMLGYNIITDAASEDRPHVPGTGSGGRIDTWRDWSRWKRGLFGGPWYRKLFKLFNLTFGLASLVTACLGIWGAAVIIEATFAVAGAVTSFGCAAPV